MPDSKSLAQRIEYAKRFKKQMQCDFDIVVDTMDNQAWEFFGWAPHCATLIYPNFEYTRYGRLDVSKVQQSIDRAKQNKAKF